MLTFGIKGKEHSLGVVAEKIDLASPYIKLTLEDGHEGKRKVISGGRGRDRTWTMVVKGPDKDLQG